MRGRKPVPTALKELRGNPGRRPIKAREPKPARSAPKCPAHLQPAVKKEWKRMAALLEPLGLLTEIDGDALEAYCVAYARWDEAEKVIQKTGMVTKAPSGYPMISPYLSVANKAMEQARRFLIEFGMTPSSRTRVTVQEEETRSPLEKLRKRLELVSIERDRSRNT